jgi:hypothetical protein
MNFIYTAMETATRREEVQKDRKQRSLSQMGTKR